MAVVTAGWAVRNPSWVDAFVYLQSLRALALRRTAASYRQSGNSVAVDAVHARRTQTPCRAPFIRI